MEEAEALCTKMGIMVAGQFKCFGSSQHIKDKYGTGYEIEIKIKTLSEPETIKCLQEIHLDPNTVVTEAVCKSIMTSCNNKDLIVELSENGLGSEYFNNLKVGIKVDVSEFYRWQFVEGQGSRAMDFLESKFKEFKVVEHYGNSYKLKVSRDNYSIGFLFGLMEDI